MTAGRRSSQARARSAATLPSCEALVVLDSVELERDELRQLARILSRSYLVLVVRDRALGEGGRIVVGGLQTGAALALVEQELGHALAAGERAAAERVCELLHGHPFELRQAAAAVRERERTFTHLAGELATGNAEAALARLMLARLSAQEAAIVAQLAALRGATVGAEHLAGIAGVSDLTPALQALERRRLIASASPRYRIAGALHDTPADPFAVASATAYFTRWASLQRARPERLLSEAPALLELIRRAGEQGRDADAIALGRASDAAFAWGRRWESWKEVLEIVLAAAQRNGDASARAWALHQLGTLIYALGDPTPAVAALREALRLREQLGEHGAAAATRHNLEFMGAPSAGGGGARAGFARLRRLRRRVRRRW